MNKARRIAIAENLGYERQGTTAAWRTPGPASKCQIVFFDELPPFELFDATTPVQREEALARILYPERFKD